MKRQVFWKIFSCISAKAVPYEFLDLPTTQRVTMSVSYVLSAHNEALR